MHENQKALPMCHFVLVQISMFNCLKYFLKVNMDAKNLNKMFIFQFSMETQSIAAKLRSAGLLRNQALIGGKWIDAYDGKTIEVC